MLGVWVLESIYWVRSFLRYRIEEAVLEFLLSCSCLGMKYFRRKSNWK